MRHSFRPIILFALVLSVFGGVFVQTPPASAQATTYYCFPTCSETDSRMLALAGTGLNTLSGDSIGLAFAAPRTATTIEIGIFDGSTGANWDIGTTALEYKLYADRLANGSGVNSASNLIATWNGNATTLANGTGYTVSAASMPNNGWWTATVNTNVLSNAAKAPSGHYFFRLVVTNTSPATTSASAFKVRTNGIPVLKPQAFSFLGAMLSTATGADDRTIVYPSYPTRTPTTYDGSWNFLLDVPTTVSNMTVWDGDMDFGAADCSTKDSDDPDTTGRPSFANNTAAVSETATLYTSQTCTGSTTTYVSGAPTDDTAIADNLRTPSVTYSVKLPDNRTFANTNPSGNTEWEQFRIESDTTTPADYRVTGRLPNGVYAVQPAGLDLRNLNAWRFSYDALGVNSAGAAGTPLRPFSIGDRVWIDTNGDGALSTGEAGVAGVTMELLDASNAVIATTTTDSTGTYTFEVEADTYTVRVATTNFATGAALNGRVSTTGGNTRTTTVTTDNVLTNDFGYATPGTISGTVFNDLNGSTTQTTGEPGIGSVTIELLNSSGTVIATTTTAATTGAYSFSNVMPGSYTVRETDPSGYTSITSNTVAVSVVSGGTATANFADQQQGTVVGKAFNDLNGNGLQGPGENGIGSVTIQLLNSSGTVVDTKTTAADGSYTFTNVSAGAYTVRETDPAGYVSTSPNTVAISVPVGGSATANFADQQQGTVSGKVFNDLNGNAYQDGNEAGLGGVTIQLLNSDGTVRATTTTATADGSYNFSAVPPGSYTVRETDPSGYTSVTTNNVLVTIGSGTAATANFADQQIGIVGGRVFNDTNGNGVRDVGENGIGSVTIELRDSGATTVIATTTTAADGTYSFTNVASGRYTVREIDPASFTSTTLNDVPVFVPVGGAASANFGEQQAEVISGRVYVDTNGSGTPDRNESGIGGVKVDLLNSDGTVRATTTTAGDGSYNFIGVPAGSYNVRETDPTGYGSTTPNLVPVTVGTGTAATANFGDQQSGTISGRVYADLNGNGWQDNVQNGLGGVAIELLDNTGTVIATTITTGDGSYSFTGVAAGAYRVRETDPAGYTSTTINAVPVNLSSGGQATANFGDIPIGRVSGRVFLDLNGNGAQEENENGIGGVTVQLIDSTGAVKATTTTTGDGNYSFTGVAAGAYTVREIDPSGYASTSPNDVPVSVATNGAATANFGDKQYYTLTGRVYDDANTDGAQQPTEGGIGGVTVALINNSGEVVGTTTTATDGSYRFAGFSAGTYTVRETDPSGYTSTTPNTVVVSITTNGMATVNFGDRQIGTVAGRVFLDANGNTVQDGVELGLGGVTIELLNSSNAVIATTITANDGTYRFTNVVPGSYTVRETDPTGYGSTTSNTVATTVPTNGVGSANFGDRPNGAVAGKVYYDTNRNGSSDAAEAGIGGVTIELVSSSNAVIATTTTTSNGTYTFPNVAAGSYTVRETDPTGYVSTTANSVAITQPANGFSTVNFGEQQAGSVTGRVFFDLGNDGIQNGGDGGVSSVVVQLFNGTTVVATTTTASDGTYVFTNVAAGTYTVQFTAPSGYTISPQNQGGDDAVDSDANSTGRTATFTVSTTTATTPQDAGVFQGATIGDFVWNDKNANGVQDANEAGIGGVTVELRTSSGGALVASTTTNASGAYSFAGVTPGSYYVRVIAPAGYVFTGQDRGTDDAKDSDFAAATGQTAAFEVTAGQTIATRDAGLYRLLSMSSLVWNDTNNNGVVDTGETGIGGVAASLYEDTNTNGVFDPGTDTLKGSSTTNTGGIVSFANVVPGRYFIVLPQANFASNGVLASFVSSTGAISGTSGPYEPAPDPNDNIDNDDNGQGLTGQGIVTKAVVLTDGDEPTNDGDTNPNTNNSVDMGVFRPLSVGGQVWNDANNNGLLGTNESGINGVTVTLYRDTNANGTFDAGTDTAAGSTTTTTVSNIAGVYTFGNMTPGDYIVVLPQANFATGSVLAGYGSSNGVAEPDPDNNVDNDDNGYVISGQGIVTRAVTLANGDEPTTDGDTDSYTNYTVDMGVGINPTVIDLITFTATPENGQIVVAWETGAEFDTTGFHIWRSSTGKRDDAERVTVDQIAAKGDGVRGAAYEWIDTGIGTDETYTYWLEEVQTDGKTREYGPATLPLRPQVFLPMIK